MVLVAIYALISVCTLQEPTAADILQRSEDVFRGSSSYVKLNMTITTPDYERTLEMESWSDDNDRSLIHTLSPRKEAGNKTLRIGKQVWMYLKRTERTLRIPPSMMMQSWNGSDFTFEDLVRESDMVDDYNATVVGTETIAGRECWKLTLTPKSHVAVVWNTMRYRIEKNTSLPVKAEYFNDSGELIRTQLFENVREMGGRTIPTVWKMINNAKPGNVTAIELLEARYDIEIDADVFSRQNLER